MAMFSLDTVPLDDPQGRWCLEAATRIPAPVMGRATLIELPFVDGAVSVPGGVETGTVNLSLWVPNQHGGKRASFDGVRESLQVLGAVIAQASTVVWTPDSGGWQSVTILERRMSEPESKGRAGVIVSVSLTVSPYWCGQGVLTDTKAVEAGTHFVEFPVFNGASAPLVDAVLTVSGVSQISQCDSLERVVSGVSLVGAANTVNCLERSVSSPGWDYQRRFLQVVPVVGVDGSSVVRLQVVSPSGGSVTVKASRWYR